MGRKQYEALVDRIARDIIKKLELKMISVRRPDKGTFLMLGEEPIGRNTGGFYANDLYETDEVAAALKAKVKNLRPETLGQILASDCFESIKTLTSIRTVDPAYFKSEVSIVYGKEALQHLTTLVLCARMFDILANEMEPIEAHEDVADEHPH